MGASRSGVGKTQARECCIHDLDLGVQVTQHVQEWTYKVQTAYQQRNLGSTGALRTDLGVEWKVYSCLFELVVFRTNARGFLCRIRLRPFVDRNKREMQFNEQTMPSQFSLPPMMETPKAGGK